MAGVTSRTNATVVTGRALAQGAATQVEINVGANTKVRILRVQAVRVSGTGANWTPRLGNVSGFAAGSFNDQVTAAASVVGTGRDIRPTNTVCMADAAGKLYLVGAFDAGANNIYDYLVACEILA